MPVFGVFCTVPIKRSALASGVVYSGSSLLNKTVGLWPRKGVGKSTPGAPKWVSGGLLGRLGRQVGLRRALWAEKEELESIMDVSNIHLGTL